jgi:hypothetical protein
VEGLLDPAERDAVLRPPRPGEARHDVPEVELDHLRVRGRVLRIVEETLLLRVRLDEREPLGRPAGQLQVRERLLVDREEPARGAVLRRHVCDRRAVGDRQADEPGAEVLDELPDHAERPQHLGHAQDEVGRGRAVGELAREAEADHLRDEHRDRLAEQRRLGLDPADAPAEHAEPVDHRRVRVGAEQRVREGSAVPRLDDARQVLEVHLVADARVRRHDLEVRERALAPAEEGVALAVALVVALDVHVDGAAGRELVHLHRVVDHELGRDQRVHLGRVAAAVAHRVAHRREVDDRRDTGEVLQEDAGRPEGDLARRLVGRDPRGDGLDVGVRTRPEDVLEQHAQRVREPEDVESGLEAVEPEDLVLRAARVERRPSLLAKPASVRHPASFCR